MERYLLVAAGGMIGAMARYGLGGWISNLTEGKLPYGTLAVNLLREGSYYLAILNMAASLFGCLIATYAGVVLAKKL